MAEVSNPAPGPILCAHLIRRVDNALLDLLASLTAEEWNLQTIAPAWRVRDVAAHLLDTALRKLSMVRDGWSAEAAEIRTPQDLAALVNRLNREGVTVYRRLSPAILIQLMRQACAQSAEFHESLDPFAPAAFSVSWAGESQSLNWFDTARELTERWHHQQQIRLATNKPGILTRDLYHPVLDCFLRGMPHLYRDVEAPEGTVVAINISGEAGGRWLLQREGPGWGLVTQAGQTAACEVTVPEELAWRLFTKGMDIHSARRDVRMEGDLGLGEHALRLTAIVA
jgi:uncharacterized protein (TIGR03083 family)